MSYMKIALKSGKRVGLQVYRLRGELGFEDTHYLGAQDEILEGDVTEKEHDEIWERSEELAEFYYIESPGSDLI